MRTANTSGPYANRGFSEPYHLLQFWFVQSGPGPGCFTLCRLAICGQQRLLFSWAWLPIWFTAD